MAFDAETFTLSPTVSWTAPVQPDLFEDAPAPDLAETDPGRLVAMLYVSPRPCAALDALLGL